MLNIHPALLPAFKGLDTHKRALEAGAKVHGATVHFVVPEMDSGPIIAQGAVARAAMTIPKRPSPPACSRSSTGSIRWRSNWLPKAACGSKTAGAWSTAYRCRTPFWPPKRDVRRFFSRCSNTAH